MEVTLMPMQPDRIGFYPVCARDYLEPLRLLKGWVEHLVFCDIKCVPKSSYELLDLRETVEIEGLPQPSFILGDALLAISSLRPVDVFFLRRDSDGEGGSELHLLGPARLPMVLDLIKPGGLLVTDRSNGRDWFDEFRLERRCAYRLHGRAINLAESQPWAEHKLLSFTVQ
jgi:hypothetical protein